MLKNPNEVTNLVTKVILRHRKELKKLLKPEWKEVNNGDNPLRGFCYLASEVLYFLCGGKEKGFKPYFARLENNLTHWWIQDLNGNIYDPTKDQFNTPIDYSAGIPKEFLTKNPSKRARVLIRLINKEYD